MTTVVSIIFSDIVPLRDRGVWQGISNIVFSAGAGIGAPLGWFPLLYIYNLSPITSIKQHIR